MTWSGYGLALGLTLAVEVPLAALLVGRARRAHAAWDAALLNLLTHPLLSLAYVGLGLPLLPLEAGVAAVEAAGYRLVTGLPRGGAVALSLALNGLTTSLSYAL